MFLSFQARCSLATRSSTSDLTVEDYNCEFSSINVRQGTVLTTESVLRRRQNCAKTLYLLTASHRAVYLLTASHRAVYLLTASHRAVYLLTASHRAVYLLTASHRAVYLLTASHRAAF